MFSNNLNVCLCPMSIEWGNIPANLSTLKRIADTIHPDTDLLIIPECFATGFPSGLNIDQIQEILKHGGDTVMETVSEIARNRNFAIAGTTIIENKGELSNCAFIVEPNGEITYSAKHHLFSPAGEDKLFRKGNGRLSVRYRGWNIAMGVCYDLRFPVWCRNVKNEYDVMIFVANWPEVRVTAWNSLLTARAIENLSYVCGVNCKGEDSSGFLYDGSSHIIDFKGNRIGTSTEAGLIYSSLSKNKLEEFRKKFPAWRDADPFIFVK